MPGPRRPDDSLADGRGAASGASVLFIGDLHLDADRPAMIDAFARFCSGPAREAAAVYILGDLFEAWIGDDDDDPAWVPVIDALAALTAAGVDVRLMAGNRDFLLGPGFARVTGVTRIPDPSVVALGGRQALLCHGDTLCTDDHAYQDFRARVRDPEWQRDFLARPLSERRLLAAGLRGDSQSAMAAKTTAAMDVNPAAARALCRGHGAELLIHGHTHRPGCDTLDVDGRTVERWVLGAWLERPSALRAAAGRIVPLELG